MKQSLIAIATGIAIAASADLWQAAAALDNSSLESKLKCLALGACTESHVMDQTLMQYNFGGRPDEGEAWARVCTMQDVECPPKPEGKITLKRPCHNAGAACTAKAWANAKAIQENMETTICLDHGVMPLDCPHLDKLDAGKLHEMVLAEKRFLDDLAKRAPERPTLPEGGDSGGSGSITPPIH